MQEPLFIGVDVSKAELVVVLGPDGAPRSVANDAVSIAHWLTQIPGHALIAMESTGRYHALLVHLASRAGLQVYVLNARDVYFYARALGTRAKTDGVDARIIARYLAEHHSRLHAWQPCSTVHGQLQQLLTRRAQVVMHRAALRQVCTGVAACAVEATALQQAFDVFLQALDAKVQALIASDAHLAQGCARLRTISGIGVQTAALLATAAEPLRVCQCRCAGGLLRSGSTPQRLRCPAWTAALEQEGTAASAAPDVPSGLRRES